MGYFNVKLSLNQIRFTINKLKEINKFNKNEEVLEYSRYVQGDIFWGISRKCGYCRDGIDESECFHKENKDTRYGSCNIDYCPLLNY